ncbi:hypothetical protein Tco_1063423 [Tanacetum coccineum]
MCTMTLIARSGNPPSVQLARFLVYSRMISPNNHLDFMMNNGPNTSGNKKQDGLNSQEVSNSDPLDALNSIENDDDLYMNERINDLERQMLDEKLVLVDDDEKPLKKIDSLVDSDSDSDSEVEEVFNEAVDFMA